MRFHREAPVIATARDVDTFLPEREIPPSNYNGIAWLPRAYYPGSDIATHLQHWTHAHYRRLTAAGEQIPQVPQLAFPIIIRDHDGERRRLRACGLVSHRGVRAMVLEGSRIGGQSAFHDVWLNPLLRDADEEAKKQQRLSVQAGVLIDPELFYRSADGGAVVGAMRKMMMPQWRIFRGNQLELRFSEKARLERLLEFRRSVGAVSVKRLAASDSYETEIVRLSSRFNDEPQSELWLQADSPQAETIALTENFNRITLMTETDLSVEVEPFAYIALRSLLHDDDSNHGLAEAMMNFITDQQWRDQLLGDKAEKRAAFYYSSLKEDAMARCPAGAVVMRHYAAVNKAASLGLDYQARYIVQRRRADGFSEGHIVEPGSSRVTEMMVASALENGCDITIGKNELFRYQGSWIIPVEDVSFYLKEVAPAV